MEIEWWQRLAGSSSSEANDQLSRDGKVQIVGSLAIGRKATKMFNRFKRYGTCWCTTLTGTYHTASHFPSPPLPSLASDRKVLRSVVLEAILQDVGESDAHRSGLPGGLHHYLDCLCGEAERSCETQGLRSQAVAKEGYDEKEI